LALLALKEIVMLETEKQKVEGIETEKKLGPSCRWVLK